MAKGTDNRKDMLVANIRPGLKREFAFAFKARSEMSESLGRTRASRAQTAGVVSPSATGNKKTLKGKKGKKVRTLEEKEEENNSDVVELGSGDEEAKIGALIESVPILEGEIIILLLFLLKNLRLFFL